MSELANKVTIDLRKTRSAGTRDLLVDLEGCCSVCDDERIVKVKSDSALLRAKGADREKPGKV